MIPEFLSQLWVQRLGWTLLHFLWQGSMIAVVYAMLRRALGRSLSVQGRYILACAALGSMSVVPPLTFLLIPNTLGTTAWTMPEVEWQRLLPAVVALWLLGVLTFSIRLLGGWRVTVRLRSTSHPAPAAWQHTLEEIAALVGARQPVRLLVSSLTDVPTVIGWLRPVILVPVEFFTGISSEHISGLLAHEMAHIRRHDYLANVLQSAVESVLFYHPAVWWVSEQVRAERELCCDDLAVEATGDVLAYARALAELESRQPARLLPAVAANGGSLVNRIRRLMEPTHAIANSLPGPGGAWAMTLLWLAGVAFVSVHSAPSRADVVASITPTPAPNTFITLTSKARDTLLYDPILSVKPAQRHNDDGNDNIVPMRERENEEVEYRPMPDMLRNPPIDDTPLVAATQGNPPEQHADPAKPQPLLAGVSELPAQVGPSAPQSPASTPFEAPPPAPIFRVATKLVQVDVIARRKRGPATGLTADDFKLLDNGRPQEITSFTVSSSQTSTPTSFPLPPGAVSNRLERGGDLMANATVLLVDQRNTSQTDQAFAIQQIVKFLKTGRDQNRKPDRIGIYALGRDGSLKAVQEITDNAELLSRAADTLEPRRPSYMDYDGTAMPRHPPKDQVVLDTRGMLGAIARHLASVPGRKGLIWVTDFGAPARGFEPDLREAARALNDANVALYAVDARGLVGSLSGMTAISNAEFGRAEPIGPQSPLQLAKQIQMAGGFSPGTDVMFNLASLTGGLALYNSNGIAASIRKALDDAELTYTLGFYPAQEEQGEAWHKLKVEVASPGIQLHYPEKYFASRTLAEASDRPTLSELLKGPLDATQLALVSETVPDRARPGSWHVRTSVDLRDVHLENRDNIWAGAVNVSFLLEGSRTARTVTRKLEIPEVQLASALKAGIVVNNSFEVEGPAGELRVVAQDLATGAAGSVRVPLGNK